MIDVYAITAGLMFAVALYGVLSRNGVIQRLLAANVMAAAVFLYLIVLAGARDGAMDPVPQAMVLTGIVIAVSVTAFALALMRWFRHQTGRSTLEEGAPDDSSDARKPQ